MGSCGQTKTALASSKKSERVLKWSATNLQPLYVTHMMADSGSISTSWFHVRCRWRKRTCSTETSDVVTSTRGWTACRGATGGRISEHNSSTNKAAQVNEMKYNCTKLTSCSDVNYLNKLRNLFYYCAGSRNTTSLVVYWPIRVAEMGWVSKWVEFNAPLDTI